MYEIEVAGRTFERGDPRLEVALRFEYAATRRARCLCTGVEMYIAHAGGRFVLKRLPGSGGRHSNDCESFEVPPELSGRGEVLGRSINEDQESGVSTVKLDFSLRKLGKGFSGGGVSGESASSVARTDGSKLGMNGLFDCLIEGAGFNRWVPNMLGKRNWTIFRREIEKFAESLKTSKVNIGDVLLLPEQFRSEVSEEIIERRRAFLSKMAGGKKGIPVLLCLGEVKEIGPARYGFKIVIKNMPEQSLMLNDDIHRRIVEKFGNLFEIWGAVGNVKLIAFCSATISASGYINVEEATFRLMTNDWIPVDSKWELELINELIGSGKKFTKGLRYNLTKTRPMATVITNELENPTAMYIIPQGASEEYRRCLYELMENSSFKSWVWDVAKDAMPALG